MTRKTVKKQDLYEKALEQFKEDRETIVDLFNDLKGKCITPEDFIANGLNLGKYAELMMKNTALHIELMKVVQRDSEDEDRITADDIKLIQERIQESK